MKAPVVMGNNSAAFCVTPIDHNSGGIAIATSLDGVAAFVNPERVLGDINIGCRLRLKCLYPSFDRTIAPSALRALSLSTTLSWNLALMLCPDLPRKMHLSPSG